MKTNPTIVPRRTGPNGDAIWMKFECGAGSRWTSTTEDWSGCLCNFSGCNCGTIVRKCGETNMRDEKWFGLRVGAAKEQAHNEERERQTQSLLEQYSWLEQRADTRRSSHALGAKNIRTELKRHFPWVKFTVTSKSFSGGNSINIRWDLGPTSQAVNAITDRYQESDFDGMQDLSIPRRTLHPELFGGAKYVHEQRSFPHELYDQVGRDLCALQHVEYAGQYTRHLYGQSDDRSLQEHVNALLYSTHFGAAEKYAGVERTPQAERTGTDWHWCRIKKTIDENDPMARFNPLKQTANAKSTAPASLPSDQQAGADSDISKRTVEVITTPEAASKITPIKFTAAPRATTIAVTPWRRRW